MRMQAVAPAPAAAGSAGHVFLGTTAFLKQVSDRSVRSPGFLRQTDFAGAVGRDPFVAGTGQRVVDLAQGVHVELRHDETTVTSKTATGHSCRLDDLFDAGSHYGAQLCVGRGATNAAVDVQRHRTDLPPQAKAGPLRRWSGGKRESSSGHSASRP